MSRAYATGPWSWKVPVGDRYAVENTVLCDVDGNPIAIETLGHQLSPVKRATRALIAAAPELLEALRRLVQHVGTATPDAGRRARDLAAAEALIVTVEELS